MSSRASAVWRRSATISKYVVIVVASTPMRAA